MRKIEIEALSSTEARQQAQSQLDEDTTIVNEKILSDGRVQSIQSIGDSVSEAFKNVEMQIPNGALIDNKTVLRESDTKSFDISAVDEETAKSISPHANDSRIMSVLLKIPGKKGFLGIGRTSNVYEVQIFHSAIVKVSYKPKVKILFEIGTHAEKFNNTLSKLDDGQRAVIIRDGQLKEKLALLDTITKKKDKLGVKTLLAAIDTLGIAKPELQESAIKLLLANSCAPSMAWKIGYELRDRALYDDELVMPLSQFISEFKQTPPLNKDVAQCALNYIRTYQLDSETKNEFEERFQYFTRDDKKISQSTIDTRSKDKTLCRQCGKKMKLTPKGPFVELRCDTCDITRFEKKEDVY